MPFGPTVWHPKFEAVNPNACWWNLLTRVRYRVVEFLTHGHQASHALFRTSDFGSRIAVEAEEAIAVLIHSVSDGKFNGLLTRSECKGLLTERRFRREVFSLVADPQRYA